MSELDWRTEAVYWRFMAGQGMQEIADAWEIGLEQVERLVRQVVTRPARPRTAAAAITSVPTATPARRPRRPRTMPQAPRSAEGKAPRTDWQAKARQALLGVTSPAQISELCTRLRVPDDDRKMVAARLFTALQALVTHGEVVKTGTRYKLAKTTSEAA